MDSIRNGPAVAGSANRLETVRWLDGRLGLLSDVRRKSPKHTVSSSFAEGYGGQAG